MTPQHKSMALTPSEVSEAARELNEKKNSWNPFNTGSEAGRTLEQWKETKGNMHSRTTRKVSSQKKSRVSSRSRGKKASVKAASRSVRRSPSAHKRSKAGKAMRKGRRSRK